MALQKQEELPKARHEGEELIGAPVPRVDSAIKSTGRAKYARDMRADHMLFARIKRCPYPHALIRRIDITKASEIPGVRAILTGDDFPAPTNEDTPALARREVLYANQAVVGLAADSVQIAEQALDRVEIEYEELPYVTDPEVALGDNPPTVIRHPGEENKRPNVGRHLKVRHGNVDEALATCDRIVENRYTTQTESHFQLEPLSFLAQPDPDGGITIWGTTHGANKLQLEVAWLLGLDPHRVRAKVPLLGGWFGSKDEGHDAAVCCKLALKTLRPVKLELSREETMNATGVRHSSVIRIKDGLSKDGLIVAREISGIYNGGAYGSLGNILLKRAVLGAVAVYNIPKLKIDVYRVYTNMTPGVPKRSPFGVQMAWAIESHVERDALAVGLDPVEFRLRNILHEGERNAINEKMESISHERAIHEVSRAIQLSKKDDRPRGPWRRGKGIGLAAKWGGTGPYQAMVRLRENGNVEVWAAAVENGQGIFTGLTQIAANELGVRPEDVVIRAMIDGADSSSMGVAEGASASRQMVNLGKATLLACLDAKKRAAELSSAKLGEPPEALDVRGGVVYVRKDPRRSIRLSELFVKDVRSTYGAGGYVSENGELVGYGLVNKKEASTDPETGEVAGGGGKVSPYYVTVAQAADVSVNIETGQVVVHRLVAAHDVGKAINPEIVRDQIIGSVVMALGTALSEEMVVQNGKAANTNLADYKLISSVDAPSIEPIIIENPYHDGPYGAKSAGEPSTMPTAPAIGNAIHDAVGVWIDDIPITPERVLAALSRSGLV